MICANADYFVAVHDFSVFVNQKTSVAVAVVGDSYIGALFYNSFLQIFHMRRAAAVIYIYSVRLRENNVGVFKNYFCGFACRAVCAVGHNFYPVGWFGV